jgi:hypothetical protein
MFMLPSAAGLVLTLMLMTVTLLFWMVTPPQPQPHLDDAHLCADGQGAVALAPACDDSTTIQLLFGMVCQWRTSTQSAACCST